MNYYQMENPITVAQHDPLESLRKRDSQVAPTGSVQVGPASDTGPTPNETHSKSLFLPIKVTMWTLFLCDLDPFEVYKDERIRARFSFKHGDHEDYFLSFTRADQLRLQCNKYLRVYVIYMMAKTLLLTFVQYNLLRYELLEVNERAKLAYVASSNQTHGTGAPVRSHAHHKASQPFVARQLLDQLSDFLGNPMASHGDLALYVHLGTVSIVFLFVVLLPPYFHRHKLNMACLRFLMKPGLEMRRIRSSIRQRLENQRQAIGHYVEKYTKLTGRRQLPDTSARPELALGQSGLKCFHKDCVTVQQLLRRLSVDLDPGRLSIYTVNWHSQLSWYYTCILLTVNLLLMLIGMANVVVLFTPELMRRCKATFFELLGCNLLHLYSPAELLTCVEVIINLLILSIVSFNHLNLIMLNTINQLHVIGVAIKRLRNYRVKLHLYEDHVDAMIDQLKATGQGACAESEHLERLLLAKERDELVLVETMCSIVQEEELIEGFESLSQQTAIYFYHAIGLTMLMLATAGMQTPVSSSLRFLILISVWLLINVLTSLASYMFARIQDIERLHWHVRADVARISHRLTQLKCLAATGKNELNGRSDQWRSSSPPPLTPLSLSSPQSPSSLRRSRSTTCERPANWLAREAQISTFEIIIEIWHRFVIASSINIDRYCVRPFDVEFTYRRVIELNFFVLFICSITLGEQSLIR